MLTFFILGDILGAGIYSLTGQVGGDVGGAIWASFLVAFLLAFLTAFAYMELVTKYPQAAGGALYCDRAYKIKFLSFLVTFAIMASGVTSATFAASRVGGNYFTGLTGVEDPPMVLIGIAGDPAGGGDQPLGRRRVHPGQRGHHVIELSGLLFIIGVGGVRPCRRRRRPGTGVRLRRHGLRRGHRRPRRRGDGVLRVPRLRGLGEPGRGDQRAVHDLPARDDHRRCVLAGVVYLLVAFTAAMTVPLDVLTESSGPLLEVVRLGAPTCPPSGSSPRSR